MVDQINFNVANAVHNVQYFPGQELWNSVREINTILSDLRLYEALGYGEIEKIQKTETGYLIKTRDRELRVDVKITEQRCGGYDFELIFYPVTGR